MITIKKYTTKDYTLWNNFVATAKNATFLFHRDFMEYHKDRFEDYSLLCFKKDKLIAILPANVVGDVVHSHQGLTYGGLIIQEKIKFEEYTAIFKELLHFLENNKIDSILLKPLPQFYSIIPSEEFEYLQFILEATICKIEITSVININMQLQLSSSRKEGCKRARKKGLIIIEEPDLTSFWKQVLEPNLSDKYKVKPVHNLQEIQQLKNNFSKNIRQFNVYHESKIVAGVTIFETKNVAHVQYISGNKNKNKNGSLDYLFQYLIQDVFKKKQYFDFGTSNENQGKKVNKGLLFWKEGFGARSMTYKTYEILTANHTKLSNLFT